MSGGGASFSDELRRNAEISARVDRYHMELQSEFNRLIEKIEANLITTTHITITLFPLPSFSAHDDEKAQIKKFTRAFAKNSFIRSIELSGTNLTYGPDAFHRGDYDSIFGRTNYDIVCRILEENFSITEVSYSFPYLQKVAARNSKAHREGAKKVEALLNRNRSASNAKRLKPFFEDVNRYFQERLAYDIQQGNTAVLKFFGNNIAHQAVQQAYEQTGLALWQTQNRFEQLQDIPHANQALMILNERIEAFDQSQKAYLGRREKIPGINATVTRQEFFD